MKKILQAIGNAFNLKVLTNEEYTNLNKPATILKKEPSLFTKPTTLLDYTKIVAMLREYDNIKLNIDDTTKKVSMKALKYEDVRISTFDFTNFKNYITYIENLATEKGITLKGISFIKGSYNEATAHDKIFVGYESLMYVPTTLIDGKETLIDLEHSSEGNIVSFRSMLASNDYEWNYDGKEDTNKVTETGNAKMMMRSRSSNNSSSGNYNGANPPYDPK